MKQEPFLFRPHRGGFEESMAEALPFDCTDDLVLCLEVQWGQMISYLQTEPYGGIDERNGWDTHLVIAKMRRINHEIVVGYTNRRIETYLITNKLAK